MNSDAKVLNVKQVAERLNVSERSVWRLVQEEREFPKPFKVRASARWRARDIDGYIDAKAEASAA